jgi:hypothetical protein
MASGQPVIAYGRGGVLGTVVGWSDRCFFKEPSVEALAGAVRRYQSIRDTFDPQLIARHAGAFYKRIFMEQITEEWRFLPLRELVSTTASLW